MLRPLLEDELAAEDAIAGLRRYSLISPAADGAVAVHRLVQAVTVAQMRAELADAWRQAAAAVIEAAMARKIRSCGVAWNDFAAVLPHVQAALAVTSAGLGRVAAYLGYSGSYAAARDLQQAICRARERVLGPEHPDTLLGPRRTRQLDREGGGCGRGPGPVRSAAARARSGSWAPSTPRL